MFTRIAHTVGTPLVIIAVVGALSGNAFTASAPDRSGGGAGAISGYVVSDVSYELGRGNAEAIEGVSFTIEPATAEQVRVRLVSNTGAWYECTNVSGRALCPTIAPAISLASADALAVQATGS